MNINYFLCTSSKDWNAVDDNWDNFLLAGSPPHLPPSIVSHPLLPTGSFKWLTDKEIKKVDLAKYKDDGDKGPILEVDLEYPQEPRGQHNSYPPPPEQLKVSNEMLF